MGGWVGSPNVILVTRGSTVFHMSLSPHLLQEYTFSQHDKYVINKLLNMGSSHPEHHALSEVK